VPEVVVEGEGVLQVEDEDEFCEGDKVEKDYVGGHADLDAQHIPERSSQNHLSWAH